MATYCGERFLQRQLDSFAAQDCPPSEVVIGDDRSSDSTLALLEAFALTAPFPVRIEQNEQRLGFRHNFMRAVARARGDLILLCDQDDVWHPDKVAEVRAAFAADADLVLAYHNARIVDAAERPTGTMFNGEDERALLDAGLPPWHYARGLVQAFRRDLTAHDDLWPASREHFSDEPLGHDRWYYFLGTSLGKVRFIDQMLLNYRQHGSNAYGADRAPSLRDRVGRALTHEVAKDEASARGALARAAIMRAIAARVGPEAGARAGSVSDRYEAFARRLRRRQAIYTASDIGRRAAAFGECLVRGDYRGAPWAFNPGTVGRDLLTGVALGRH